ncbi:MAG: hypothetical protein ACXVXL_09530, partial [Solirubrobacteraceae bacterium]
MTSPGRRNDGRGSGAHVVPSTIFGAWREHRFGVDGTVRYALGLRRRPAHARNGERLERRRAKLDGLGSGIRLGLSDELEPLIASFADADDGAPDHALDAPLAPCHSAARPPGAPPARLARTSRECSRSSTAMTHRPRRS